MDGLVFAEKFLGLVTSADHNSTYKMATAVALMQVAQEQGDGGPDTIPTDRAAEVVIDLYGRHAGHAAPLRQMNRDDQESRILTAVRSVALVGARYGDDVYRAAVQEVEDALLAYPLRLLQHPTDQFLFDVPDPTKKSRRAFGADFDGRLRLRAGVLHLLQRSAPLVRPLVESAWVTRVARYNGVNLDETALTRQMFGYERRSWPGGVRAVLEELQDDCFYCGDALPRATQGGAPGRRSMVHVDHFFPWARTMNDGLDNLVLADSVCNSRKRDLLPAPALVVAWASRIQEHSSVLSDAAAALRWPCDPRRTTRAALVLYQPYEQGGPSLAWNGTVTLMHLGPAAEALRWLQGTLADAP